MTMSQRPATSRGALWTGRVLTGLCALFLLFDATIHLIAPAPVVDAFARLGFPIALSVPIGIVELLCVILYVLPSTAVLGAVLLTGYLGGAVATQLRAGSSLFGETLFPVYVGIVLWAGLMLRDNGVRALIPLRRARQRD
ncbi:MAG TPA: DoxX family protein [Gemmatimonadaceae bacterium]|nr:DoxX family protein [Gemmatimonadaceae bacterium]